MLVLARRQMERLMIGDEISIQVLEIRGDVVRLGVTAPKSIEVHREEIYETIVRQRADDPTRQTITPTLNRQEARVVADCLWMANGEVAGWVADRIEKLMAEKYA